MKVDELDKDIIWLLAQNSGLTPFKISKLLKVPEQKIRYRLANLESNNWIKRSSKGYVLNKRTVIATQDVLILFGKKGFWVFTAKANPRRLVRYLREALEQHG
ncbi:MAG TPA: winged helix-turn-helix domain-containing protein [Thermococcus sp.]|nr:winged helix-turn-helix domain-containing protein [Thermococcus sp.]